MKENRIHDLCEGLGIQPGTLPLTKLGTNLGTLSGTFFLNFPITKILFLY